MLARVLPSLAFSQIYESRIHMGKHGYVGERERRGEGDGAIKPDFSQGAYHDGRSGSWGERKNIHLKGPELPGGEIRHGA